MDSLFSKLGIDWKLLAAQGGNFLVLLFVLTKFAYRPLMRIMEERRKKIQRGLDDAEESKHKLASIEELKSRVLATADKQAVDIIGRAEQNAKIKTQEILHRAEKKAEDYLANAATIAEHKRLESEYQFEAEAKTLLKNAIAQTIRTTPENVDEQLITQAVEAVKTRHRTT